MFKKKLSKFNYLLLIIVTLILAVIFYSGTVMRDDVTGRIIVGSLWLLLSAAWLGKFISVYFRKSDSGNTQSA